MFPISKGCAGSFSLKRGCSSIFLNEQMGFACRKLVSTLSDGLNVRVISTKTWL